MPAKHLPAFRNLSFVLATLALGAACQSPSGLADDPGPPPASDAVPVPGRYLDHASAPNGGLLTGIAADGTPALAGDEMDPRILEARRFYDTLQYPGAEAQPVNYPDPFTGQMEPTRKTAPLTLAKWKEVFGFSAQAAGETLAAYRQRTGIVVYYNKNELGLGRELGCAEFDDGPGKGAGRKGVACFVSNYGQAFNDPHSALALAAKGTSPRNTVCITYRPSLPPGYEVQFYTFGADGKRMDWAQLDTLGARPHPHVCMNCHGGTYDSDKHLAKNARFLPLDPNLVLFAEGGDIAQLAAGDKLTRAEQEEPMRVMNALALATPVTKAQREMVRELYQGRPETVGQVSDSHWAPAGWQRSPEERELYDKVVKPYCATCHLAIYNKHEQDELPWYSMFQSLEKLRRYPMAAVVCGKFTMPNAQPTLAHFWGVEGGPLTIGDRSHASPADAFLDIYGLDRAGCDGLATTASCNRGPDPDALCGNAASGATCDRDSGRCLPPPP